jgi:hypothetical protein
MSNEKNSVAVESDDLTIANRKDDCYGRAEHIFLNREVALSSTKFFTNQSSDFV